MGGIGKTQTVVEYIYRHASEYDIVWWISAEHPAQITASLVELAKRLGLPESDTADTAVRAALESLRRGEYPHSRWILVFDNADRPESIRHFVPAGTGHVVITSRSSAWEGVANRIEVDVFSRAESKQLLTKLSKALAGHDADRLAEALGDLPMAIAQAAAWRAQTGMPVEEYLEQLKQNRMELLGGGASGDYPLPVATAWNTQRSEAVAPCRHGVSVNRRLAAMAFRQGARLQGTVDRVRSLRPCVLLPPSSRPRRGSASLQQPR
jgi:hypothetical protein